MSSRSQLNKARLEIILLCIFQAVAASPVRSTNGLESNLNLFGLIFSRILDKTWIPVDTDTLLPVVLLTPDNGDGPEWLIEQVAASWLRQRGHDRIFQGEAVGISGYTLELRPIRHSVTYAAKNHEIERCVSAELNIKLVSPADEILISCSVADTIADRIPHDGVKGVENDRYSFTQGVNPAHFFARYGEPVIVTMITGAVIYLFYAFRSK